MFFIDNTHVYDKIVSFGMTYWQYGHAEMSQFARVIPSRQNVIPSRPLKLLPKSVLSTCTNKPSRTTKNRLFRF